VVVVVAAAVVVVRLLLLLRLCTQYTYSMVCTHSACETLQCFLHHAQ
jgi:hypothetical protein